MKFSEEQVKDIVTLKESLIEQIDKHQESIETLETKTKELEDDIDEILKDLDWSGSIFKQKE